MKSKMQAVHVNPIEWHHPHHSYSRRLFPPSPVSPLTTRITNPRHRPRPWSSPIRTITATSPFARLLHEKSSSDGDAGVEDVSSSALDDVETEMEEIGKNSRRIWAKIAIDASLLTVWNILTDYERLSDFIPGLAVSQLLEKTDTYVRLYQIGEHKLAFGINFNAKGIVDCFEKDLETLPFGQRRDIEFKMIKGDFQLFEGKWSIEQYNVERSEDGDSWVSEEFNTTLSYVVDVKPKMWLPVGLVEGRLCREIKMNLSCIRDEAIRRS